MGIKHYMPLVSALLLRMSKNLQEGKELSVACYLLFSDGYSPLPLKPSAYFYTYANAVISTKKPIAYLIIKNNVTFGEVHKGQSSVCWVSATIVYRNSKSSSLGRRYVSVDGAVRFLDEAPAELSNEFNVPAKWFDLYNDLPSDVVSHDNFNKLIDTVTALIKITKIPYSKPQNKSLN